MGNHLVGDWSYEGMSVRKEVDLGPEKDSSTDETEMEAEMEFQRY